MVRRRQAGPPGIMDRAAQQHAQAAPTRRRVGLMTEDMLTAREAAELLAMDYAKLSALRSAKKGPAYSKRADGRIFYRRADIDEWAEVKRVADEEKARQEEADREYRERIESREREMNDGHEFAGWKPAKELSDEEKAAVAQLVELGGSIRDVSSFDNAISRLEGDLVPTCACGWRGYPEPWKRPARRGDRGGQQFMSHQHQARLAQIQRQYAASIAAAALSHAAESWDGDEQVADWLTARAEFIKQVGEYDSEN